MINSPVVMIADLIADGDQDGWTALTKVAIPVMCGHDMEVPERMLNCILPATGDQAARIFSPGAATSGYIVVGSQGKTKKLRLIIYESRNKLKKII
jgi:hypothetical protein